MALSKKEFSDYIKQFNFRELFNDMGWNNDKTTQPIVVDNEIYTLKAVAEKCGLKILTCEVNELPNNETRRKLDTQIKRLFFHYILICVDKEKNQKWIIPIKKSEKRELTGIDYASHQVPEFLYQKVSDLTFSFEQEENLTIVDVSNLVNEIFTVNSEKVTKQFYEKFKKEHSSFLQFIKGISDKANQDWYASLMLNRLMFCYFIQKKGFLDNNKNYLRDKLKACKEKKGEIKFYSFYRSFLLVLFHKGLNEPEQSPETKIEIGKIPYLNGGLFDEHKLEQIHTGIEIDDQAFDRLFDFFDQYEWHLDTSITATGKDINPDVIGYIFEKYINDRANMGAYYTKEDITDYISKNSILPYLFDETKRHHAKAFAPDGELWQMVKQSDDLYIYDAVKKGVELPLPKEIEQGINDVRQRTEWNKPAPGNYALPTEIWREVVDRRNRYTEVKTKIDKGEITAINDFITYNLNIRQFAQDAVENTTDPELLRHFYKALNSVTIIDPTCGSGAFLFAAMNILEPLYGSCIERMENFVAEAPPNSRSKYKYFEEVLAQVKSPEHPNLQYFIYKSIILRNLYGVDIMNEAVEIAKIRLFLKLVATVEADYRKPNLGLEPLPDIDFNIRAGNTLVGFAKEAEIDKAFEGVMDFDNDKERIKEKCKIVADAFKRYKEIQLTYGDDFKEFKTAKEKLNERLKQLNHQLNQLLHKQVSGLNYEIWQQTHQPFHWFAEFYEIVQGDGGFDVIIGNPPYVEMKDVRYKLQGFEASYPNLYSYCVERSLRILKGTSTISMIVPLSLIGLDDTADIRSILFKHFYGNWFSSYAIRPAKLFNGAEQRLCIFIANNFSNKNETLSTKYYHWSANERKALFEVLKYNSTGKSEVLKRVEKTGVKLGAQILNKLYAAKSKRVAHLISKNGTAKLYYHRSPRYWIRSNDFEPYFQSDVKSSSTFHTKLLQLTNTDDASLVGSIINSSLFFFWFIALGNGRNLTGEDVISFPIGDVDSQTRAILSKKFIQLMTDYQKNSVIRVRADCEFQEFKVNVSKPILDEIDAILAKHYSFTDEELDFIINYDIKYRMGKELGGEDEE